MSHEISVAYQHTGHKILNKGGEAFLFVRYSCYVGPSGGDFCIGCDSTYHAKIELLEGRDVPRRGGRGRRWGGYVSYLYGGGLN